MTTLARSTFLCLILAVLDGCTQNLPESETVAASRKLDEFADPATGCEYLGFYKFGLVARIAADGKTHMGCKGAQP